MEGGGVVGMGGGRGVCEWSGLGVNGCAVCEVEMWEGGRTALEKTSIAPKSVWVVSVEMGPRSVVFGRVWTYEGAEEWRARDRWGHGAGEMRGWRCDGWRIGGRECGGDCLAARIYSVDRRARRRGMLGGVIVT